MVDSLSSTPIGSDSAVSRVAAPTPVAAVKATPAPVAAPSTASDAAPTSGLARTMAASAPVDTDRVATIKKAIAEGRFPILPATIADRLLALKLDWHPDDSRDD